MKRETHQRAQRQGEFDSLNRRTVLAGGAGLLASALGGCQSSAVDDAGAGAVPTQARTTPAVTPTPSPTPTHRPPPPPGPLPGVGTWIEAPYGTESLADSGARWFYTWAPDHPGFDVPEGCEFVPMIEDEAHLNESALERATQNGDTLLGFNEPELRLQANTSVSRALEAWPMLEDTGMRLGAPALAGNAHNPASWLGEFMQGVEARNYRVDFVPVHWYLAPELREGYSVDRAVDDLHGYIARVYDAYGLPIWLTEFSLITWYPTYSFGMPTEAQAEFLAAAAEMMTELDYVERWAWFSLTPPPYAPSVALYDNEGHIAAAGRRFQTLT